MSSLHFSGLRVCGVSASACSGLDKGCRAAMECTQKCGGLPDQKKAPVTLLPNPLSPRKFTADAWRQYTAL
jgi:hypothetical protein